MEIKLTLRYQRETAEWIKQVCDDLLLHEITLKKCTFKRMGIIDFDKKKYTHCHDLPSY